MSVMAAKAQMDRLHKEGNNIGSWEGKKVHKVEFLYEAAEKCRAPQLAGARGPPAPRLRATHGAGR